MGKPSVSGLVMIDIIGAKIMLQQVNLSRFKANLGARVTIITGENGTGKTAVIKTCKNRTSDFVIEVSGKGFMGGESYFPAVPCAKALILADDIDLGLHPKTQREVLPKLLKEAIAVYGDGNFQIVITTHSPLVCASIEPYFIVGKDKILTLEWANPLSEAEARDEIADILGSRDMPLSFLKERELAFCRVLPLGDYDLTRLAFKIARIECNWQPEWDLEYPPKELR
jgi:hypothetical protein